MKKAEAARKLYIKNMVCLRCIKTVRGLVEKVGGEYNQVGLGEVELSKGLTATQVNKLSDLLKEEGFELLDNKDSRLVSEIKNLIIQEIHSGAGRKPQASNYSRFLSKHLGYDYSYLSKLFSAAAGITIEKFIISHKIERVKELLVYNELTLTEIAYQMHYSSVAHLSTQFKKVTGLTPSHFKQLKQKRRNMLEFV